MTKSPYFFAKFAAMTRFVVGVTDLLIWSKHEIFQIEGLTFWHVGDNIYLVGISKSWSFENGSVIVILYIYVFNFNV